MAITEIARIPSTVYMSNVSIGAGNGGAGNGLELTLRLNRTSAE